MPALQANVGHVAALVIPHTNGLLPFESTVENNSRKKITAATV